LFQLFIAVAISLINDLAINLRNWSKQIIDINLKDREINQDDFIDFEPINFSLNVKFIL